MANKILQSECSNTIKNALYAFRLYAFIGNTVMSITNFSTKALKLFKNSIKETLIEVTVDNEGSITFLGDPINVSWLCSKTDQVFTVFEWYMHAFYLYSAISWNESDQSDNISLKVFSPILKLRVCP